MKLEYFRFYYLISEFLTHVTTSIFLITKFLIHVIISIVLIIKFLK